MQNLSQKYVFSQAASNLKNQLAGSGGIVGPGCKGPPPKFPPSLIHSSRFSLTKHSQPNKKAIACRLIPSLVQTSPLAYTTRGRPNLTNRRRGHLEAAVLGQGRRRRLLHAARTNDSLVPPRHLSMGPFWEEMVLLSSKC